MATARHVITVESDSWSENRRVRDLVAALQDQLAALARGEAKGLTIERKQTRYGDKLIAKTTVTTSSAQIQ